MYALKTPSFLRPSSRPSSPSPRPDSAPMADRPSRSSILSFSNLKRTASPLTKPVTPVVQDGSYMAVLNLKLSEAVSKALNQPTATIPGPANELLNGRRPIPLGRGRALGDLIISYVALSPSQSLILLTRLSFRFRFLVNLTHHAKIHISVELSSEPFTDRSRSWSTTSQAISSHSFQLPLSSPLPPPRSRTPI